MYSKFIDVIGNLFDPFSRYLISTKNIVTIWTFMSNITNSHDATRNARNAPKSEINKFSDYFVLGITSTDFVMRNLNVEYLL